MRLKSETSLIHLQAVLTFNNSEPKTVINDFMYRARLWAPSEQDLSHSFFYPSTQQRLRNIRWSDDESVLWRILWDLWQVESKIVNFLPPPDMHPQWFFMGCGYILRNIHHIQCYTVLTKKWKPAPEGRGVLWLLRCPGHRAWDMEVAP